jgi:hypothetical protein
MPRFCPASASRDGLSLEVPSECAKGKRNLCCLVVSFAHMATPDVVKDILASMNELKERHKTAVKRTEVRREPIGCRHSAATQLVMCGFHRRAPLKCGYYLTRKQSY